MPYQYF